ncbi:hypothetical protein Q8A67_022522 [Cirrhinus molitorella]|uniref:Uncharacterized protein n=1 Tax=Cirrhinus molitorella TaxID=172907 RepID=A0AA88P5C5_9TELE|nr:hypothetical protein Q8A67_022522 [Cirrhinus molitorella]
MLKSLSPAVRSIRQTSLMDSGIGFHGTTYTNSQKIKSRKPNYLSGRKGFCVFKIHWVEAIQYKTMGCRPCIMEPGPEQLKLM